MADNRKGLTSEQNKQADIIDTYLRSKGSPLVGHGGSFVFWGDNYGINPMFLVAIAGSETNFGKYGPSQTIHNPFGMGPGIKYPSWEKAIAAAAKNLHTNKAYAGKNTISEIGAVWAPKGASNDPNNLNHNWPANVSKFFSELGQDPKASVRQRAIADKGIIEGTKDAIVEQVPGKGALDAFGSVASAVMDWHFWARVSMVIGGGGLIFFGLRMFFQGQLPGAKTMRKVSPIGRIVSKASPRKADKKAAVKETATGVATEVVENA